MISVESFIAGFAYGMYLHVCNRKEKLLFTPVAPLQYYSFFLILVLVRRILFPGGTTVCVGQPLETMKTLRQVQSKGGTNTSLIQTATNLYSTAGIRGFYRGGMPLLFGGGLMRSAQFGVYQSVVPILEEQYGAYSKDKYWLGCINPHVVAAGFAGGIGRGLVETPFEMVKVRRQVVSGWKISELSHGFGATLFRNSLLFSSFVMYMDIFRQQTENIDMQVTPFIKAGTCANLAWLTVWPLDVVKTRRQSGKFDGKSLVWLLGDAIRKGEMYKGLSVGLARSFIANGASMEVYTLVERELKARIH